uniref:Uncharacterized protein n=1 Tax=Neolamprologus brichardi TaxID=32507 RepID=A0A3Q4MUK6_NEOBR
MAGFSKYLTARNSSIAGSILFVFVLLKHRKRTKCGYQEAEVQQWWEGWATSHRSL